VLPPDHPACFVRDFVGGLDLWEFYADDLERRGQPPCHPRMMVGVWLYGYMVGIRSSRKLEQAIKENLGFQVVAGNQQPDHWTLFNFRRRHHKALGNLFDQTVLGGGRGRTGEACSCGRGRNQGEGQRLQAPGHELRPASPLGRQLPQGNLALVRWPHESGPGHRLLAGPGFHQLARTTSSINLAEPPDADPHVQWGGGERDAPRLPDFSESYSVT